MLLCPYNVNSSANHLKISVVGAHGTGKTTLSCALVQALRGKGIEASLLPEVPRDIVRVVGDQNFFRRQHNTLPRQMLLLVAQPVLEAERLATTSDVLVCDRTILDHWAYTRVLFSAELRASGLFSVLHELVRGHSLSYSHVFVCRTTGAPEDDGMREDDIEFQQQIDQEIVRLVEEFGVHATIMPDGIENRLKTAIDLVEAVLKR